MMPSQEGDGFEEVEDTGIDAKKNGGSLILGPDDTPTRLSIGQGGDPKCHSLPSTCRHQRPQSSSTVD